MTIKSRDLIAMLVASIVFLAACEQTPDPTIDAPSRNHVVVYFAGEDETHLRRVLDRYADVSGVPVIVRRGSPQAIVDDLIANDINPPADVLVTTSVVDISRAAEEGALRPLFSPAIEEQIPAWLRDPDDLWIGLSYRSAVIVYGTNTVDTPEIPAYAALAEAGFSGQLCMSSSKTAVNRSIITMLIDSMGVRPAELVVRGWMANLALPVIETEDQLVDALRSGECRFGIVSSSTVAKANAKDSGVKLIFSMPAPVAVDIQGVGVSRHARNPNGAVALVNWLFQANVQSELAKTTWSHPAIGPEEYGQEAGIRNVGLVAWHEQDVAKLAERARYP
jgi:iron(III) transport system substrate-binding protein